MPRITLRITIGLLLLFAVHSATAQDLTEKITPPATAPVITGTASAERLRFTAPNTVVQMHLQIYADSGQLLFDVTSKGNVLDWTLQDSGGEHLVPGSYLCVVTVKSLSGKLSQRIGSALAQEKQVELQRVDATLLTAAQQQAVGPIEENGALTILKAGEAEATNVIAHDGSDGLLVRSRGALSFRTGDFFSGKDTEQMRLTAEGNLGIGITHPQARLDVDGLIRASQGIIFPDGTTQYSAASKTLGAKSTMPDQVSDQILGGKHKFHTETAGGTQNHIAKWTDSIGTLGDSAIIETISGGINVATFGGQPTVSSNNHVVEVVASGTKTPLTLVAGSGSMEFWRDQSGGGGLPTAAVAFGMAAPGVASSNDMVFSAWSGTSWAERMRLANGGNLGIGTTSPTFKLHLVDPSNTGLRVQTNTSGGTVASFGGSGDFQIDAPSLAGGRFIVKENGNVGIGTATPATALEVAQGPIFLRGSVPNKVALDSVGFNYGFISNPVGFGGTWSLGYGASLTTPGTPVLSWNDFGSVGIGTMGPTERLEVAGFGRFDNPGNDAGIKFAAGSIYYSFSSGNINIAPLINTAFTSGNVGIGTESPSFRLHLIDTGNTGLRVQTNAAGGTVASFASNGDFQIDAPNNPGGRFIVKQAGNVGIGTAGPTETLSVNGTASKLGGGSWSVFSDERLKNIKGHFNSGLKAVMQLQPIRYEYKRDNALGLKSETENIGFGAQSLQKIIPEAVTKNSAGYLMVNNDPILWTMLNAIKEQQKEIAELKGQVQKLRAAAHRRQSQALERLRQTGGRSFRRPAGVGNRGETL